MTPAGPKLFGRFDQLDLRLQQRIDELAEIPQLNNGVRRLRNPGSSRPDERRPGRSAGMTERGYLPAAALSAARSAALRTVITPIWLVR
jgi:hypothetical protein